MNPSSVFRLCLASLSLYLVACSSSPVNDTSTSSKPALTATGTAAKPLASTPRVPEPHESVPVYLLETDIQQPVDLIERIKAFECISGNDEQSIWAEKSRAIDRLQKLAFGLNADAVVGVSCSEGGLKSGCWGTQLCEGDAVRILAP